MYALLTKPVWHYLTFCFSSFIVPSLKLSSPGGPACCQRGICLAWSDGSHLSPVVLDPQVSRGDPPSPMAGNISLLSLTLLLLRSSVAASSDSLDMLPSPSSSTGTWNLFCICKSVGGREDFLLLPKLTSFQSDTQMKSPFHTPVSTDSTCLSFSTQNLSESFLTSGNSDTFLKFLQKC